MKKFTHLHVPETWRHYWSKYPEGYTILESLLNWVSQVNDMVDKVNNLNLNVEDFRKELDSFIDRFDDNLKDEVISTLEDWQESGFLDIVINEALDTMYHEMNERLTAQANLNTTNIKAIGVNIFEYSEVFEIALKMAIEDEDEENFYIPGGTYPINNPIQVHMGGKKIIKTYGIVNMLYHGNDEKYAISITTENNELTIAGNMVLDCTNRARNGLRIINNTTSMDLVKNITIEGLKVTNVYGREHDNQQNGIYINGGFDVVKLENIRVENVSRARGVGQPGVHGAKGIYITHGGLNSYPKRVFISQAHISNITNSEEKGSSYDVDCDGIAVYSPITQDIEVLSQNTTIEDSFFYNCKGRAIKSQSANTTVKNIFTHKKNIATITNSVEVDFQRGNGLIDGLFVNYSEDADLGQSHAIVKATATEGNVFLNVNNVEYENNISIYNQRYLIVANTSGGTFASILVSNIQSIGLGYFNYLLRGDLSNIDDIVMSNISCNRIGLGVISTTSESRANIVVSNVHQQHSIKPDMLVADGSLSFNGKLFITNVIGVNEPDSQTFGVTENGNVRLSSLKLHNGLTLGTNGTLVGGHWDLVGDNQNSGVKIVMVRDIENFTPQYANMPIGSAILDVKTSKLFLHFGAGVWKSTTLN